MISHMGRLLGVAGLVAGLFGAAVAEDRVAAPRGGMIGIQVQGGQEPAAKADFTAWAGSWVLTAFGEEDGTQAVPEGAEVTFILGADGKVSGRSACNNYGGQALTVPGQADGIRFGPMFSTRMACPGVRMEVEQRYLAALEKVARGSIQDKVLRFTDADGHAVLLFRAK